jgi:hypothetical protein
VRGLCREHVEMLEGWRSTLVGCRALARTYTDRIHSSLINDLNAPVKIARAQTRTRLPLQLSRVPMIVWRCAAWL